MGTVGSGELVVVSLPGGALLGYVTLPGVRLHALAAPPAASAGGRLVVLDASGATGAAMVLPWPPPMGYREAR